MPKLLKNAVVIIEMQQTQKILNKHKNELELSPLYSANSNLIEHKKLQTKTIRKKQNALFLRVLQNIEYSITIDISIYTKK